jgi:hypothetical protein
MKTFDRRTTKFVDSFLKDFRDDLNRQLKDSRENDDTILEAPTTDALLFVNELTIPDSMGSKKFISRH